MKHKHLLLPALLLAAALCAASCGDSGSSTPDTDNGTLTAETSADGTYLRDNLPADLDFSGKTFRLLTSNTTNNAQILVEEETGDLLDDAKFRRISTVSERFDITFTELVMEWVDARDNARNCISAGDDAYELASIVDRAALTMITENMLYTFDDLPYADLSAPWWNASINDCITVAGKQVLAYSDFSISTYDFTHVLVYNKQMAAQLNLDSPYDLVEAGTWTIDVYASYLKEAMRDVNGNGRMDQNDTYGFLSASNHVAPTFWIGAGVQSVSKDSDDIPVYAMDAPKMMELMETAYNIYIGEGYWYSRGGGNNECYEKFANGGSLFVDATFGALFKDIYRSMEADYGIIPFPKYDEAQDTYYTRVEGGTPYVIPTTADAEFASAVLEALSCESYNMLLPIYYELALKTKLTRDDRSAAILDMMMQNRIYDLGDTFFCSHLRDNFVDKAFSGRKLISASTVEANAPNVESAIENLTAPFIN